MYGLNALQTFKVNILLTIAVTAGGLIILSASASAQQHQNLTSNQTTTAALVELWQQELQI